MFCSICNKDLRDCECPDLEERLNRLKKSPFLAIDLDAIIASNKMRREAKQANQNVKDSPD